MSRFEWAHATDGYRRVDPDELDELAPDGNERAEWGVWMGDEVMIYGLPVDMVNLGEWLIATFGPAAKDES